MKRNFTQAILPVAIPFFILVFPFYPFCSCFAEANPFSTDLGFENPDRDDQFFGHQQDGSRAFVLTLFFLKFNPKVDVLEHSFYRSSQPPSVNQENFTLRCSNSYLRHRMSSIENFLKLADYLYFSVQTQKGGREHV